jgi:chemotaxis protein histidine kinase CheA
MTTFERNVKQAQWRLGVNDWFSALGWCLVWGTAAWCVIVLADKLFGLSLPSLYIFFGLVAGAVIAASIWVSVRRHERMAAAAALDAAAGLKERTSSGLYCLDSEDPFAKAVIEDAEQVSRRINVRSFIKYSWPSSLSFASAAILAALIVTWLPIGPLQAAEKKVARVERDDFVREDVKKTVKKLQRFREQAEKNSALRDLEQALKTIDDLPVEKMNTPVAVRREAIKKIDKVADALRKSKNEKLNEMKELSRMFRGLRNTKEPKTPTEKLSKALSKGDFRTAQDAVKELREQLAKLKAKQDPEQRQKMQEQIQKVAQQLKELAKQEERKKELENELKKSGVDPETAKRALENLTKADIQKMKEQMKKQGADQKQIKEMMNKLQSQKKACQSCSKMGGAMQKAAQMMQSESSMADASAQLQSVGETLSEMEQMKQQLSELESMLADAQQAQNDLSDQQNSFCQSCSGKGCKACNGSGSRPGGGMGQRPGQGRGGRGSEHRTGERWVKERTKVITTKGSIIGKKFIDGEQVRGEVGTEAVELFSAAERDATDALNKTRIPNHLRKAVKSYFSQFRGEPADAEKADAAKKSAADGAGNGEAETEE